MARLITALALLSLAGCATQREWIKAHPRTTTFVAASLILTSMQLDGHDKRPGFTGDKVATPGVDCSTGACK